jgi:TonB family protein
MIVLRGTIGADGAITNMEIYRGIVPDMDSAALAAFTKWKFKPAMHDNKAIAVDVLIGVPVRIPAAH